MQSFTPCCGMCQRLPSAQFPSGFHALFVCKRRVAASTMHSSLLVVPSCVLPQLARRALSAVLTSLVLFFLMLNFLLAIVVEACMNVREEIERSASARCTTPSCLQAHMCPTSPSAANT